MENEIREKVKQIAHGNNLSVLWQVLKIMYDRQQFCQHVEKCPADFVVEDALEAYNKNIKLLLNL
jgi:hypothetical protein